MTGYVEYEGDVYRPPSEARSVIIQATIGCSHNRCTFCCMYRNKRFRVRELAAVERDLVNAASLYPGAKRLFLADGNALVANGDFLVAVLKKARAVFPTLERVAIYAGPQDILDKGLTELRQLAQVGLDMVYLGLESGSDTVLKMVAKGATAEQMIQAGLLVKEAGMLLSVMVILGLGGKEFSAEHARETARVLSVIDPPYAAALTLLLDERAPLYRQVQQGRFQPLSPMASLAELRAMIAGLEVTNCVFRSNHASNYLPVRGTLPEDKPALLQAIDTVLARQDPDLLRPEGWRAF